MFGKCSSFIRTNNGENGEGVLMTAVQTIVSMQLYFGITQLLSQALKIVLVLHQRVSSNGGRKRKRRKPVC